MKADRRTRTIGAGCLVALLLLLAGSAGAIEYHLTAMPTTLNMPDGVGVPAWGYAVTRIVDSGGAVLLDDPAAAAKVPGDPMVVPHNDPTLTVFLTNQLPENTSIHILGQQLTNPGTPTFVGDRVMSFVTEAVAGGPVQTYQWDNFKPGTYMAQSATNPAKQVQMGLFAAVVRDGSASAAYPGVIVNAQRILVFHDVDPEIQQAVHDGRYGEFPVDPADPDNIPSSPYRKARYFLITGKSYPETTLETVGQGLSVLLRFVNAGLETHVPQILNTYLTLVAQDGIAFTYPKERYGFELSSAATMDAVLEIPAGTDPVTYTIYDAIVANMSNMGTYQNGAGGAVVKLLADVDSDNDGVLNSADNCILVANPNQRDTNGDGFGNYCDPDLDDSGLVDTLDFLAFRSAFGSADPDADFDGNGIVATSDFLILRNFFGQPPGPSGVAP